MEVDEFFTSTVIEKHKENSRVKVFVRLRPLLEKETQEGLQSILQVIPEEKKVLVEEGAKGIFVYDGVCDEDASQEEIFEIVVSPLLKHVHDGHNVTVIAYGQTGSGKTYTIGTNPTYSQENGGMLQRVMTSLLESPKKDRLSTRKSLSKAKHNLSLKLTFLEVYNESVYDLFNSRKNIETKADGLGGVVPTNCKEEIVHTSEEGLILLEKGNSWRSVAATTMNNHSSRSHALITLTLYDKMKNGVDLPKGSLRMVDLAGAEGVGRHNIGAKNFSEGVNINKGLLAVGKVLTALSSNNSSSHIPYRESIVTRLLRDALGGNNYTAMVVCVSPVSTNISMTLNTLRYAEQAKNIKIKPSALSTIKRKGMKRKSEDVSATPCAWKKFASGKKMNPNSTISTPGHKPPLKKIESLNSTFITPLNRMSEFKRPFPRSSSRNDLSSIPDDIPLKQPVFEETEEEEEETSPAQSLNIPTINNTVIQYSPLVDRVSSRLEESILQCKQMFQMQMENMEDRISKRVAQIVMNESKAIRRSKRLEVNDELKFHPSSSFSTQDLKERDDECPISLIVSVAETIANKENFKVALKMALKEEEPTVKHMIPEPNVVNVRKPFRDLNNTEKLFCDKTFNYEGGQNLLGLPVTSTVACSGKVVRRSTRLSSRNPHFKNGSIAPLKDLSMNSMNSIPNFSSERIQPDLDDTIIFNRDYAHNSPELQRNLVNVQTLSLKDSPNKDYKNSERLTEESTLLFGETPPPVSADKKSVNKRRRQSTRRSALDATRKNADLLTGNKVKETSSCKTPGNQKELIGKSLGKAQMFETTILPSDSFFSYSKLDDKGRRRSTRRSALIASQKNAELLSRNESPLFRSHRKATSGGSKKQEKSLLSKTYNISCMEETTVESLGLIVSPTTKKEHVNKVLKFLNTSNLRELQKLPTIGPKTAMVIYNFRNMFGNLETVEDLQKIPGLTNSFYTRFIKANLMFQ